MCIRRYNYATSNQGQISYFTRDGKEMKECGCLCHSHQGNKNCQLCGVCCEPPYIFLGEEK